MKDQEGEIHDKESKEECESSVVDVSVKRWRESSPHMQECKTKLEKEPKMQANMQSGLPARSA